jgi:hypothetical protein
VLTLDSFAAAARASASQCKPIVIETSKELPDPTLAIVNGRVTRFASDKIHEDGRGSGDAEDCVLVVARDAESEREPTANKNDKENRNLHSKERLGFVR